VHVTLFVSCPAVEALAKLACVPSFGLEVQLLGIRLQAAAELLGLLVDPGLGLLPGLLELRFPATTQLVGLLGSPGLGLLLGPVVFGLPATAQLLGVLGGRRVCLLSLTPAFACLSRGAGLAGLLALSLRPVVLGRPVLA
jgi:hypothetical protein